MRLVLALVLLWWIAPAVAQSPTTLNGPQPIAVWDFMRMNALPAGSTFTRTTTEEDYSCKSGKYISYGINVPALGVCDPVTGQPLGLGIWSASTINNTWARDLTQVSYWTPTNMTAALTATGIDASASSASLLTAISNNGVICGAATGTLQLRELSAYVQRVSGSGTISMSMDGINWTDVTSQIASGHYTRVPSGGLYISNQTFTACFKLGTSGDSINVDAVNVQVDNNNNHYAPTPPVFTVGTPNVLTGVDVLTIPLSAIPGFTPDRWTIVITFTMPVFAGAYPGGNIPSNRLFFEVDDGTVNNGVYVRTQSDDTSQSTGIDNDFNVSTVLNGSAPVNAGKARCTTAPADGIHYLVNPMTYANAVIGAGYDVNTGLGIACSNGVQSGSQPEQPATQPGFTKGQFTNLVLGGPESVGKATNGYLSRVAIYSGRLTSQALTAAVSAAVPRTPNRHQCFIPLGDGSGGYLTWEGGPRMQGNQC